MEVKELEKASFDSLPALQDVVINGGVLRYANGVSKRANSFILSSEPLLDASALVDQAEQFYRSKKRCVSIKVCAQPQSIHENITCSHSVVDEELARRGYEIVDQTTVMIKTLTIEWENSKKAFQDSVEEVPVMEWLTGHYALKSLASADFDTHLLMLKKLNIPRIFLVVRGQNEEIIATGYATLSGQAIGIYGLATHASHQRQGLASGLLKSLELWGKKLSGKTLYLQVESSNATALGLYQKFGFTKKTNYWYRISH